MDPLLSRKVPGQFSHCRLRFAFEEAYLEHVLMGPQCLR